MGIEENRPTLSKFVDMRCFDLRVTVKAADPVILVIDGNEENVRLIPSLCY